MLISDGQDPETPVSGMTVEAVYAGEWLPVEELRGCLIATLRSGGDIYVNVEGTEYLDAHSFQLLLAAAQDRRTTHNAVRLLNVSAKLSQWIAHAGATTFFS